MNYEIIQIHENTWRIEDGGVRLFLLAGTEKALLIDSGMNLNNARDIAAGLTNLPLSLLNTHADRDHIGSNEQFDAFYMHPAEEPVYRRSGKPGTILPVREGDALNLGDRELRIIHLPGHTPGSIAVLDVQNKVLISGAPSRRMDVSSCSATIGICRIISQVWNTWRPLPTSLTRYGRPTPISPFLPPLFENCMTALKPSWTERFKVNRRSSLVRALSSMIWDSAHCCAVGDT